MAPIGVLGPVSVSVSVSVSVPMYVWVVRWLGGLSNTKEGAEATTTTKASQNTYKYKKHGKVHKLNA